MPDRIWADQSQEIADLKAAVAAMQKTIVQLQSKVSTLQEQQSRSELRPRQTSPLAVLKEAVLPARTKVPISGEAAPASGNELSQGTWRLTENERGKPLRPMVFDDVQAGPHPLEAMQDSRFAGFHEISDSDWWIHVGGLLKMDAFFWSNDSDDTFTNALSIAESRIHVDLRKNSDLGPVRLYYESNFNWGLRHLYMQIGGFTFGQTWSAFYDPAAAPDMLNYASSGLQGYSLLPQIRYTFPSQNDHFHLTMAVESSSSQYIYGRYFSGTLSSRVPDVILQARWEAEKGHVQLAGVLRDLHFSTSSDHDEDTLGYGLSLTGALHLGRRDHIMAGAVAGNGMNRYSSSLGYISASVSDAGELDLSQAWSAFIGYQHLWTEQLRSQISWRHASSEDDASYWTTRVSEADLLRANLIWMLNDQFSAGLEYSYDLLNQKGEADEDRHGLMFSLMYRFF